MGEENIEASSGAETGCRQQETQAASDDQANKKTRLLAGLKEFNLDANLVKQVEDAVQNKRTELDKDTARLQLASRERWLAR